MNTRPLKVLFIIFFLISIVGCNKPTYSKEKVKQYIINLCKNEYGLNVDAKIIGSTLGVYIPIEGLVGEDLKLNRDAGEKIEDVALSIHRITMSTDKPLKFYILTARDTKVIGAEFVLTGFVYDVARVRLMDISRGEYYKRILRDFRFNPLVTGKTKIKELFQALNENSSSIEELQTVFYPIYAMGEKTSQKIEITEIRSKEISGEEALFYIKTKEYYKPLSQFEAYKSIFPPGFRNEYLILVNISMLPNPIKDIVPKYFYSGTEIRERNLKDIFNRYVDIGYVGIDGLPKKDLKPDWFLSQQIARRIKILFEEDKHPREKFTVEASQGLINNKIFRFKFSISSNKPSDEDEKIIFSKILKLVGTVLHRYAFEDFGGVELIDTNPGGKKVYLSKVDLELFRKNRIKIQQLLTAKIK